MRTNLVRQVLITGDIRIQQTGVLTIQPGTVVEFELLRDTEASGARLSHSELIIVGGQLIAAGTPSAPILFTSSTPDTVAS